MHFQMRCFLLLLSFLITMLTVAKAQARFRIGAGLQMENATMFSYQPQNTTWIPLIDLGLAADMAESKAILRFHIDFQHATADKTTLILTEDQGVMESAIVKNIRFGPGIEYRFFRSWRIRPMLGAGFFIGIPVEFEYEIFGRDNNSNYPLYTLITGGLDPLIGWQGYAGFEGKLTKQISIRMSVGRGGQSQYFYWEPFDPRKKGMLFNGKYTQSTVSVFYSSGR